MRRATGFLLGLMLWASAAHAHLLNMTRVSLTLTSARELEVQVDIDLALLFGDYHRYRAALEQPPAEREKTFLEIGRRVTREIGLERDGQLLELAPHAWRPPTQPTAQIGDDTVAAMTVFLFRAALPPPAQELKLAPGGLAKIEYPLAYTFAVPAEDYTMTRWLELPGVASRVLRVGAVPQEAPRPAAPILPGPVPVAAAPAAAPAAPAPAPRDEFTAFELRVARVVATVLEHLRLGFLHIFPRGIDHVLFVLGLFFLSPRWRPLLSQTTVFTVAHTTTLGLSAYGIFSLPAGLVEPLIALSIAYVAVENIVRPRLGPARLGIVFAFGLLHGLGFASSLSEVPMPRDRFFTALLAFNVGVDVGQLAVIAAAFLAVGWWRERPWYRRAVVIPCCGLIAATGAWWTVERTFF
jgi:hypothetical protein